MDLKTITVTDISNVVTVYSERGRRDVMRQRKSYGLSLCMEGQITYVQNGQEYISSPGNAVILPKGATYSIHRDKTGYFPVINFDCAEFLCDTVTVIPIQNSEALISDYERMKKLFGFEGTRAQMFSIFYGILHKLGADNIPYGLAGAVRLIRKKYTDASLTNAELAAECDMSEVYFRKLFVRYFNTSPKQYIIELRIQKAKQQLSEGRLNVAEISDGCGFSNPYHFSRLFKQHTGLTPSEYKRANMIREI